MIERNTASCRLSASCIASRLRSHRSVEPSMSLNRKVTVPVGSVFSGCVAPVSRIAGTVRAASDDFRALAHQAKLLEIDEYLRDVLGDHRRLGSRVLADDG